MKKKYFESVYGKQHERVAPKSDEHIKAFIDSMDMPSISGAKERYYVIGSKSSVSKGQSLDVDTSTDGYRMMVKEIQEAMAKERAAALAEHEKKREYYEGRMEVEIMASIETAISTMSFKWVIDFLESASEEICARTNDHQWRYTVTKQYCVCLLDKVQLEKAQLEAWAISMEIGGAGSEGVSGEQPKRSRSL